MSLSDFFRGVFGLRGERRPRDPFFGGITREEEEEEEEEEEDGSGSGSGSQFFGARPSDDFGFGFAFPWGPGGMRFHDSLRLDELFQDFNDLFNEMGAWPSPARSFEFPHLEAVPPVNHSHGERRTLRDSMLKYPESQQARREPEGPTRRPDHPFQGLEETPAGVKDTPKEDRDLDLRVTSEGLQSILPPAQPQTYFKSVSVSTVVTSDGTVEQRRTVRDSQGCDETVVTRRNRGEPLLERDDGHKGDLVPFGSRPGESMGDASSILDAFFRRWFPSR